jgi:hypothetical protein
MMLLKFGDASGPAAFEITRAEARAKWARWIDDKPGHAGQGFAPPKRQLRQADKRVPLC